jgi:hypothetical protein
MQSWRNMDMQATVCPCRLLLRHTAHQPASEVQSHYTDISTPAPAAVIGVSSSTLSLSSRLLGIGQHDAACTHRVQAGAMFHHTRSPLEQRLFADVAHQLRAVLCICVKSNMMHDFVFTPTQFSAAQQCMSTHTLILLSRQQSVAAIMLAASCSSLPLPSRPNLLQST